MEVVERAEYASWAKSLDRWLKAKAHATLDDVSSKVDSIQLHGLYMSGYNVPSAGKMIMKIIGEHDTGREDDMDITEERNAELSVLLEKFDAEIQRQIDEWAAALKDAHLGKQFFEKMHDGVLGQFLLDAKGRPKFTDKSKDGFVEVRQGPFILRVEWDIEDVLVDAEVDESGDMSERVTISHEAFLRNPKHELQKAEAALYKKTGGWKIEDAGQSGEPLVEYEVHVKDGWAHDDEGNRERVKGIADGTYSASEWGRIAGRGSKHQRDKQARASLTLSPQEAERIQAVDRALEYQPKSKFLKSVRDQLMRGKKLTSKQSKVVREILNGLGGTKSAKLFEASEASALDENRTGFVFPGRANPVGGGKGSWPIGDKKHALIAISYMKAGKGKPADYPKIKKSIAAKYGKDQTVMSALKSIGEDSEVLDATILTNLYPEYPIW